LTVSWQLAIRKGRAEYGQCRLGVSFLFLHFKVKKEEKSKWRLAAAHQCM
jgi:hypothetical protein